MNASLLIIFSFYASAYRMDADTGMVIERDYKLMRFGHSEADKRLQRSQKFQKDKVGQMKKVDACLTTNPLVVLGGFWEQKRGKMILRCKSGRRPRVKVLAHCIKKEIRWEITPSPSKFSSMDLCKEKKFLKPGSLMSLKKPKNNKKKNGKKINKML